MPPQHVLAEAAAEDGVFIYSASAVAPAAPGSVPAPLEHQLGAGCLLLQQQPQQQAPPPAQPRPKQGPRPGFWELHCQQQPLPQQSSVEAASGTSSEDEGAGARQGQGQIFTSPPAPALAGSRASPSRSSSASSRSSINFWGSHVEQQQPRAASSSGLCSPRSQGAQQQQGCCGASTCSAGSSLEQPSLGLAPDNAPTPHQVLYALPVAVPKQQAHSDAAAWYAPAAPRRQQQRQALPQLDACLDMWPLLGASAAAPAAVQHLQPLALALALQQQRQRQQQAAFEPLVLADLPLAQVQLVPKSTLLQVLEQQQQQQQQPQLAHWPAELLPAELLPAELVQRHEPAWLACPPPSILGC